MYAIDTQGGFAVSCFQRWITANQILGEICMGNFREKRKVVKIYRTHQYRKDAIKYLTPVGESILENHIGAYPSSGQPCDFDKSTYYLEYSKEICVTYKISKTLDEIFLISIQSTANPEEEEEEKNSLEVIKEYSKKLRKVGIGFAIKEIIDFIEELL